MADDFDDDEQDETEGQSQQLDPAIRKRLRELEKQAKTAAGLQTELDTLRAESAFSKALGGTYGTDPRLAYFRRGYQGDVTEEAIRAAAEEAGFLRSQSEANQQDLQAHERIARASAGGTPPPSESDVADLVRAWNEGRIKSPADVLAHAEARNRPTSRTAQ